MSENYYLGTTPTQSLGDSPRYWYALRRNDDGELFVVRSDQLSDFTNYDINVPGDPAENFEDFETGIDFFDGIDTDHEPEYANMLYTQYRWDNRSMFYYVNGQGQLVQRLFRSYNYPDGVSS